ncbi:MAG: hypothetical protein K2K01_02555, partial [Eubacterium sp.]|nr:hypothetical protein [Eubacterium sp.]
MGKWKSIKELRETDFSISGNYYTVQYAKGHNIYQHNCSWINGKEPTTFIPELLEVDLDENKEIIWSPLEKGIEYSEQKEEFVTSLGTFVSHNYGEFGGNLITSKENIFGNFINVFECDDIT